MTSSETKNLGGLPPRIQKGNRVEQVVRKPSFKCPGPNRPAANQRITRKVTLPMSKVQELTCKFNELSQTNPTQIKTTGKGRRSQPIVKSKLGANGKASFITVVICRKPSSVKLRKQEERKRGTMCKVREDIEHKPSKEVPFNINEINETQRNVLRRVNEFEKKKSSSNVIEHMNELEISKKRTSKILVPKVIVDIDLSEDKCLHSCEVPKSTSDTLDSIESQTNKWSVKTAIGMFEKNLGSTKIAFGQYKTKKNDKIESEEGHVDENENKQIKNENITVVKLRPIATIKPILKKTEDRNFPVSTLSPKDSLYRKKYIAMKRDQSKGSKENVLESITSDNSNGKEAIPLHKENEKRKTDDYFPCSRIESLEKLKNTSALYDRISNSGVRWQQKDNIMNERQFAGLLKPAEKLEKSEENGGDDAKTANLKPNASFLWSKKDEGSPDSAAERINRSDMPLPLPPEHFIPEIANSQNYYPETLYENLLPKSTEEFDKSSNHSDETVYDDIGVYNKSSERYEKINNDENDEADIGKHSDSYERESDEVRKKNFLNNMVNGQISGNLYCESDNSVYNYEDAESVRYHYIRRKNSENNGAYESESYQYGPEDNNIYEDIQSVRNRLCSKDGEKEMYEDIQTTMGGDKSVSNCYESVYDESYSGTDCNQPYIRSNSSDVSNNSGKSAYEKSNSLYGMTARNLANNNDHRSNSTEVSEHDEHDDYRASPFDSIRPFDSSESSHSNSDEWVEVSDTESEQTIYLVQERPRKIKSGAFSWAQKERRRRLKMKKKQDTSSEMRVDKDRVQFQQRELSNRSRWSGSSSSESSSIRKRRDVGDVIFVSSHSVIFLGDFENKLINIATYDFEHGGDDGGEPKIVFTIPRPLLRKKWKPAPSFRVVLYKTDERECQEIVMFLEDESKNANSEDHFYESIKQYENCYGSNEEEREKSYHEEQEQLSHANDEQIYNEDMCIDDFDSQSSDEEINIDAKLPETPNNGYNLTKSLKAAGKKLRKNFSLRTSDFGKSLKRFKKQSRPKLTENSFGKDQDMELSNASPTYASNSGSNISVNLNNSDSSTTSSNNFVKGSCAHDAKNCTQRKTWTFRNKFRKGSSTETATEQDNSDARSSVFYLSLNEVRGAQKTEKRDELLHEIQNIITRRNSSSLENVSERKPKESARRQSQLSENRISLGSRQRPPIPPPPPPIKADITHDGTKYSDIIIRKDKAINNSLYVESGLFDKQKRSRCLSDSNKSWYAAVGLYAANENSSHGRKSQMFIDEPLYQFYTECVNQQARDDILKNYDSEGYEEINDYYSIINEKRRTLDIKNVRPNFEDFNDDISPKTVTFRPHNRTLWCQIPVVVDSCILQTLPDQVKKLQEAKFEILTSEESYMNSLNVLVNHFMKKIGESSLIAKRDFKILFSNILPVKKCSENFLNDLENCWQSDIMLNGICEIVHRHSSVNFSVYVKYCKNQISIYRTLRELIDKNSSFEAFLKDIESDPVCQNLSIHSFLMLPMQRITRLPLLLGAVLARLDKSHEEYEVCKSTFEILNKIVQECDEEARRMEKCEEMLLLSQQIEFPREIRGIPIITGQRFLVKSGQVTQLVNREENKLTFGKKFSKINLTLFLFTDLLVITKKKSIRNYVVVDHCPRNLVQMQTTEGLTQIPVKLNSSSDSGGRFLMLLTMLENHEKKTVEMVLSFEMESDRQRWQEAVAPKLSENPDESIYEEWDCPQVIALYEFTSTQPDELSLCIGDVVNVLTKMSDGWYQGERLRDGARGWFPENHTQEILSPHVRAKNKKLRYKILALSGNFIESQMKNGK